MPINLSICTGAAQALSLTPRVPLPEDAQEAAKKMGPDIIFEMTLAQRNIIFEAEQDDLKKHVEAFSWVKSENAFISTAAAEVCDAVINNGAPFHLSILGNVYEFDANIFVLDPNAVGNARPADTANWVEFFLKSGMVHGIPQVTDALNTALSFSCGKMDTINQVPDKDSGYLSKKVNATFSGMPGFSLDPSARRAEPLL